MGRQGAPSACRAPPLAYGWGMSSTPSEPDHAADQPQGAVGESGGGAVGTASSAEQADSEVVPLPRRRRHPNPLTLATMAAVAVRGLDPARLALPQEDSSTKRVVGVVDTQGRHWEVIHVTSDAAGASLDAEAEVLRRIARVVDDGRVSFDVSRPAGSLRDKDMHLQVRSHIQGRPLDAAALHPGPGLSAGLGRALGELHELPTSVISEAGLPVYDIDEVRQRWMTVLDESALTGKVPPALLTRWEQALQEEALWRFKATVVHGDLAEENILTAGGAVVSFRGWSQAHVGDPAEDMAWVYATVPVNCLDSIEAAYDLARAEGVDKHLRDRAELASEMSLARWLLHGVRSRDQAVVDDAVGMLADLADQVGEDPLIERHEPRLAPVPGRKVSAGPEERTTEVPMVDVASIPSPDLAQVTDLDAILNPDRRRG